jgi:tetratricopeptide (TPR) repeat protein
LIFLLFELIFGSFSSLQNCILIVSSARYSYLCKCSPMNSPKYHNFIFESMRCRRYIALLSSLLIQFYFIHSSCAGTDLSPVSSQLSQIEQRLFFRDYDNEDEATRLSRIEKNIFGETHAGEVNARLAIINAALPRQISPDKESTGSPTSFGQGSIGAQQTSSFSRTSISPAPSSSQPYSSQFETGQDDSDQGKMAVLAAKQKDIFDLLAQGVALWKAKKAAPALEKFAQVVRLDPQNAQAHFSMGVIFEAQGNVSQAKNSYQQAQQLEPENRDYIVALEAIDKKIGLKEKSNQGDSQLRQLADDAASAYQRGEYLSALDLYKQLDEKTPNQALVKWNIGSLYLIIKNPQMALKFYKEACKLNPGEERYKQALKQLEDNIKAEEVKEKESDNAWKKASQSGSSQSASTQPKNQVKPNAKSTSKAKETNVLLYYGITAKHNKEGAKIVRIEPNSRAAQVGLKEDDLIKAVDGSVTTNGEEVNRILSSKPPGARFQFTVQRGARLGQILF